MFSIECFRGLPFQHESFLIKRYDSFVTTCRYIETFHTTYDINYLTIKENDCLDEVLIFNIKGNNITCLNSLAYIDEDVFEEFTKYIFVNFPAIQKIRIESTYNSVSLNKSVLLMRSDDFIIHLPPTIDDYYQKLGRSIRTKLMRLKRKLQNDFPNVKFITKIGTEIDKSTIDKIIQLNFERIKSKGNIPTKNHTHANKIYQYSQYYGCVSTIEIDGLIVAGSIAFMSDKSMAGFVVAHDNTYSKYNAGQLCMIYQIQFSIEKGFTQFHLLWGELEYKTRLLGKPQQMFTYEIYRSFSLQFFISGIKEIYSHTLFKIRLSKYSLPLRNTLKKIRKTSSKELKELEY